jgi:hypothetical protein
MITGHIVIVYYVVTCHVERLGKSHLPIGIPTKVYRLLGTRYLVLLNTFFINC